jgi:integrase
VLAAVPGEWRTFFEFLAHTGLRISEAIGLTWQRVELGARPRTGYVAPAA